MAKIIAFPTRAVGLGPQDRAPLQDLARRLCGAWRCEEWVNAHRGVELVMIPEEWGNGDAPAFRVLRTATGFVLFDCRRTQGFGRLHTLSPEHLGSYADTRDIALVIADLVGTRTPALPVARTRRRRAATA
jgi:hypothetical protein